MFVMLGQRIRGHSIPLFLDLGAGIGGFSSLYTASSNDCCCCLGASAKLKIIETLDTRF
jgi:hypothetical protein